MSDFRSPGRDRLRVMVAIYDAAGGSTAKFVNLWSIRDVLGLDDVRMADAVDFLNQKGLIETVRTMSSDPVPQHGRIDPDFLDEIELAGVELSKTERLRTPPRATITALGLSEIAQAEQMPGQRTQNLQPLSSLVYIGGSVYDSALQVGSPGGAQNVEIRIETVPSGGVQQIRAFLTEYNRHGLRLSRELDGDDFSELQSEIGTLQAQVTSPRPKAAAIRLSLSTVRKLVGRAPDKEPYAPLLALLEAIEL